MTAERAAPVEPGIDPAWAGVLAGLRADRLDCLQANLAVLADAAHGTGTHLRLGAATGFRARAGDPLPSAAPTVADRLAEVALAGLAVESHHERVGAAELRSLTGESPWWVVADAYFLPWVAPYFGHEHVEHSFLLVADGPGGWTVVDGYHLDAPTGLARPGTWSLTHAEIDAALPGGASHAVRLVERAPSATWVPATRSGVGADAYVAAYRDLPDRVTALARLTVETWTMARAWRLAAAYAGDPSIAAHSAAIDELAEHVYLASRRVARGRPEPAGWPGRLADLLRAEPAVGTGPAAPTASGPATIHVGSAGFPAPVRDLILDTVALVLAVPVDRVRALDRLAGVPGFNSFRMLDIVERVEAALGVELPPDLLTPANLGDVDRLTALFAARVPGAAR